MHAKVSKFMSGSNSIEDVVVHQSASLSNMSGLVSKWADDKELVNRAQKQDGDAKAGHKTPGNRLKNKWDSSITVSKAEPLASKWASKGDSEEPEHSNEPKHDWKNRDTIHRGSGRANSAPKTASHGSTHGGPERGNKNRNNHNTRSNRRESSRAHQNASSETKKAVVRIEAESDDEEGDADSQEEDLPPLTDAAKSFAARLGLGAGAKSASVHEEEENSDEGFVTTDSQDHSEDEANDKELAPITEAGISLAQRLGMISVDDKPKTSHPNRHRENEKPRSNNKRTPSARPASQASRGSYQTPRRKKLEAFRKAKEEEDLQRKEEEKLKEARLKAEVQSMFEKLNDTTRSWADIEDDD